jgi:hypothetical protein
MEGGCRICSVLSRIRILSYVEIWYGLWRTESELSCVDLYVIRADVLAILS